MAHNISVLFVDDEANVLAAIKRMLRSKRDEWKMEFVESGAEALTLFEDTEFDVIVSDIRMPGMDGAELLTRVKDNYPGVIRIALSGQVDLNEVIRSIRAVHQYISKPCDADALVRKVEGAIKSRDILTDPQMQDLVTEIDALPVIPKVFQSIEEEFRLDEPSIERIAELISMDVGLVAKILKLVNSPYFGLPSYIDSVFQAITMLGLDTIKALILSTHLFAMYDEQKVPHFSLNLLWEHSFRVSNIARLIAQCEGVEKEVVIQARMAGLLHDVGKLILASQFPDGYTEVLKKVAETKAPVCECEMEVFGVTHAELGAYLMGLWGMSPYVVHGIGYHHQYDTYDLSVPMFVAIANAVDHHCVVIHPEYAKIGFNKKMLPDDQRSELLEKWINYIKDQWVGMDEFQNLDGEMLAQLRI